MGQFSNKNRLIGDQAALLTGIGLGFTLTLQITTLNLSDITGIYNQITTVSRFCALIGSYLSIVGILLIARFAGIERSIGHDRLVKWHRLIAPYSLYFVFLHVLLVGVGYAGTDQVRVYWELWTMARTYPWMLPATLGFFLLILAGVTSYRVFRSRMKYETWYLIHLYTYLGVALSFMHQILTGQMFITHPLAKAYWIGLYVSVAGSILLFRILIPAVNSIRHQLKVARVVEEGPGIISIYISGRGIDDLKAAGGQFFSWRFINKSQWYQSHPYSLSAAPTNNQLRITVKALGDSSLDLKNLETGTRVFIEGPYGIFTSKRATQGRHIVLVGGGVGITPLRAIMDEFPSDTQVDVLYRVSNEADLVLRKELDEIADRIGAHVHYLVGSRSLHIMDPAYFHNLVPNFSDADIYMCGPESLVSAVRKAAKESGVPKDRLHEEAFAYHGDVS